MSRDTPCRVLRVCNWTIHRKFATTFPALQYWLWRAPVRQAAAAAAASVLLLRPVDRSSAAAGQRPVLAVTRRGGQPAARLRSAQWAAATRAAQGAPRIHVSRAPSAGDPAAEPVGSPSRSGSPTPARSCPPRSGAKACSRPKRLSRACSPAKARGDARWRRSSAPTCRNSLRSSRCSRRLRLPSVVAGAGSRVGRSSPRSTDCGDACCGRGPRLAVLRSALRDRDREAGRAGSRARMPSEMSGPSGGGGKTHGTQGQGSPMSTVFAERPHFLRRSIPRRGRPRAAARATCANRPSAICSARTPGASSPASMSRPALRRPARSSISSPPALRSTATAG